MDEPPEGKEPAGAPAWKMRSQQEGELLQTGRSLIYLLIYIGLISINAENHLKKTVLVHFNIIIIVLKYYT